MAKWRTNQRIDQAGISQFEFVVSIIVVTILVLFLNSRLERMIEDVERVSFEGVHKNIQAQLTLKIAYWFAEQEVTKAEELKSLNPMSLVQHQPSNYAGELMEEGLADAAAERWYFITDKQWLVYKAKRYEQLENEFKQPDLILFQVQARYSKPEYTSGIAIGADLEPVYRFEWKRD